MASFPPQSASSSRARQSSSQESPNEEEEELLDLSPYAEARRARKPERSPEPPLRQSPTTASLADAQKEITANNIKEREKQVDQELLECKRKETAEAEESNISASVTNPPHDEEPKKCWICYTDETEDSPLNAEWRSPCPCALYAHEACLLDWLADLENPKSRRYSGRAAKMHCPQCKSEIVIARPRSLVVDFMRKAEKIAGRLVLPGLLFTMAGTIWAGCCAHGVYSMYLIFGPEEAKRILDSGARQSWNPRLNLGLPVIPLTLIFSRTRYAESLLPAIPVIFFATHRPGEGQLDLDMWPPSASVTFAALPYAKSFYGLLYEKLFGRLERKWIAEVQPRAGEAEEAEEIGHDENHNGHIHHREQIPDNEGEILMEIGLELELGMGDDDHPPLAVQAVAQGGDNQQAGGQEEAENQQGGAANPILGRRQNEIIHDTSNIADTVLGALLFPAISAGMGGLLKVTLPKSWTMAPVDKSRAGFLQTKWGRSIVGGCLFVLLKDALVLYCRWKLAQSHRKRRVLNYDRTKKRVVDP
ncbi:hypothetical protein CIRG_07481 [Coccidioides immitis RMSCC 2394]|uniref:RING-CH-type domain-containing protein n=1 Tax=Coccidioides immitis RMSCC 2394 TaxID=404692 RepID=A0A0J6YJH4_COCIT|nr:hypothetical protein CIRG_07481 [Coccidioides immitis RMSCC 2394]